MNWQVLSERQKLHRIIVWIDTSYETHKRTDQHFKYTDADLSCIYITTERISVTTCIK